MSNCMGKRPKKMASGGKPNLQAMGEKVTPPVNVKQEKEKQLRKKRYEVEKDMPAKKLADMADRARRRNTGSQAKMQEMGSVTEPRTAKSKLKRRFGADTSKEDYGRKASGGSVKKMAKGGFPDLNKDGKVTKADILKGRGVGKAYGGKVKKMAEGGMAPPKGLNRILEKISKDKKKFDGRIVKSKKKMPTQTMLEKMKTMPKAKKMATGGKVKGRRGDGICSRGRTKGRMV